MYIPKQTVAVLFTGSKPTFENTDYVNYLLLDCNKEEDIEYTACSCIILSGVLVLDEEVPLEVIRRINNRVRLLSLFEEGGNIQTSYRKFNKENTQYE